MKIGIITFHWAANYGAVLQAYALSSYLKSKGCAVEIINYRPRWAKDVKPIPFSFHIKSCITYLDELYKRKVFDKFRKRYLPVSEKEYVNISAHLQSSVFKLSKDLIDSIHEEGIVAYTS